jgi:hypothetical protein
MAEMHSGQGYRRGTAGVPDSGVPPGGHVTSPILPRNFPKIRPIAPVGRQTARKRSHAMVSAVARRRVK